MPRTMFAGLLILPLLAFKAAPVVVADQAGDPAPNPLRGGLP
jgi:hypothetical protein